MCINTQNYFKQDLIMAEQQNGNAFSIVMINLFKGVLYAEDDPVLWQNLISFQARVRDYAKEIGLELVIYEDEGFAWLQTKRSDESEIELPRLVQRRQLSYPVSLLLALLRRKLTEHDATSNEGRLILGREEVAEMIRTFLPAGSNEAKLIDQIDSYVNKVVELGFVRRLRSDSSKIEVRRLLKAFVDAQWLNDFDIRLKSYLSVSGSDEGMGKDD